MVNLIAIITKGKRHVWYDRTTKLAKLYRKLYTGDGLDTLLKQFVARETELEFKQRVELTNHITTTITSNIMDVFNKVPRANYQRILTISGDESEAKVTALEEIIKGFWGTESLDAYVSTRWLNKNATDPNAFVVVEFDAFDHNTERAKPYPFEVSSAEAIDYEYKNNTLQYLVVGTKFPLPTKKNKDGVGEKFTVYLADETFKVEEIDPQTIPLRPTIDNATWVEYDGGFIMRHDEKWFIATFGTPHNAGVVPAKQFGYTRDAWSDGMTFVSPYHAAVPLLMKSIKANSELDITMAQQVFPHRAQYMPACPAPDCLGGHMPNGDVCGMCHGSGHASITSAQNIIYIKLPKPGEDLWDLEKLLVFKGPPVELVKFQSEYVDALTEKCKSVVFNSETFTQEQVQATATGKMLDRDNLQDTLYACALNFASIWEFLVFRVANFADLDKGALKDGSRGIVLEAKLLFSKDFKLKGLGELMAELESAKRSEAGPAVVQHIQDNVARLIYTDDPMQYIRWSTKEKFNPFSGYTADMVTLALTDPLVPQRYKSLYLMQGVIFNEIEAKNKGFYEMPAEKQQAIVNEAVAAYIDESGANDAPALTIPIKTAPAAAA